jgi:hypothetical protein
MGVPCMPVRTLCLVIGRELHGALGTLIAPPAPPVPFTPSQMSLWVSAITTHYGMGDPPVANVIICGEPAVQKGADSKYLRPHVVIVGIVPPNVIVGPVIDMGFFVLVIAVGCSKPIWGPTTVKVAGKAIAVMAIPYIPINPYNQLICSDPCDLPVGFSAQMPSNVFAGMSLGDYLLCLISLAIDMVVSFILNLIFGGLDFLGTFVGKRIVTAIEKALGPKIIGLIGKGLAPIFEHIGKAAAKKIGERFGAIAGKAVEEGLKKLAGAGAGIPITPDEWLGFGKDNRD